MGGEIKIKIRIKTQLTDEGADAVGVGVAFGGVFVPGNGVADVGPGAERDRGFGWSDVMRCPADDAGFAVENGNFPARRWFEIVRSLWIEPTEYLSTASFKAGRVCKGGLGIRAFAREPFDQRAKKIEDRDVIAGLLFGGRFGSQGRDGKIRRWEDLKIWRWDDRRIGRWRIRSR